MSIFICVCYIARALGALYLLVERAARRLRRLKRLAGAVRIEITYADHVSASRQARLSQPGDLDGPLFEAARRLLEGAWTRRTRLRYLGLSLKELQPESRQLCFFEEKENPERVLLTALDALRARFGEQAVRYGRTAR